MTKTPTRITLNDSAKRGLAKIMVAHCHDSKAAAFRWALWRVAKHVRGNDRLTLADNLRPAMDRVDQRPGGSTWMTRTDSTDDQRWRDVADALAGVRGASEVTWSEAANVAIQIAARMVAGPDRR